MFQNLVSTFRKSILEPKINAKMEEVGHAMVAEATRLCPVDSGFLKSTIGYTYNAAARTLTLHADAKYSLMVELGTRKMAAQPYLRPALNVVPRIWRGGLGAVTGFSTVIQAANHPAKYHARTAAFARGKLKGARLSMGHGKFT